MGLASVTACVCAAGVVADTVLPVRGGRVAAHEEPELLAGDTAAFFRQVVRSR